MLLVLSAFGLPAGAAASSENAAQALARLGTLLAAVPGDLEALAERAAVYERAGQPMHAFLDRREILRQRPADAAQARLAAYDLAAAGAPEAAALLARRYPGMLDDEPEKVLARLLAGDVAARRIRWGWAEPVFAAGERRHEADAAIPELEKQRLKEPANARAYGDLMLGYRLADRMAEVVAAWAQTRPAEAPYWVRNAAADAYLALGDPARAETLYRSFAVERAAEPQPWLGLYWAGIEQRHYSDASIALDELSKVPGQELSAEIQAAWLQLFEGRTNAGQRHFESLFSRHPGDRRVREGLATSYLWQGWQRRGLGSLDELLARTTLSTPRVDNPAARIARAGALAALGDLGDARQQATDLVTLYPENLHARRLFRDIETRLSPELHLEGRYNTSDRGLGETWTQLEVTVPIGTRARLAAGGYGSQADDRRYTQGDVRDAYLGLSLRPRRWLSLSTEAAWDISGQGLDRGPALSLRAALSPDDRWRLDLGYARGAWRDLALRARAAGIDADTVDAGVSYTASSRWNARLGGGRSTLSDDNQRTWGLGAVNVLVREGPVYRASLGAEVYGSENSRSDVGYFSPRRDRSASLSHRSEWVTSSATGRRHAFSILLHAGIYDQAGFDPGPVGGVWLQSDLDLAGRAVLVVGAGARSQLYDGSRELDPQFYLTLRRRF
jgi:biofilm PGA synthesis protein PgaA